MAAIADETAPNDASNPNSTSPSKHPTKRDDDKNIHVPKDKKLKIEYVSVKNAFLHGDVCFYDIHVKTAQHNWHVTKRYSQFEDLHSQLLQISKEKLPLIPAKHYKWFTDHTKRSFIEKRRALLDNYVKKLIQTKGTSSSQCVVGFFHDDKQTDSVVESRRHNPSDGTLSPSQNEADSNPNAHSASPSSNDHHDGDGDGNDDGDRQQNQNEGDENGDDDGDQNEDDDAEEKGLGRRLSDDFEFPDDQEVTNIVIQSTRKMTDHVLYQICVSNSHKRASFRAWTVLKRFTQFYEMDVKLRASLLSDTPDLMPQLPPPPSRKLKFVHDHMDDDFIEERRVLLENYLSKLLRFPKVVENEDFLEFLGVDM